MSLQNHWIEEYKCLRNEVEKSSYIVMTIFLVNVSAIAALISYGFSSKDGFIFLTPFAIIIPSLFLLTSTLESVTRTASYIKVFIETNSKDLKWETRLFKARQEKSLPRRRKYTLSLSGIYGLLSFICSLLSYFNWDPECRWTFLITIIPIALLTLLGIFSLNRAFSNHAFQEYSDMWEKIKQNSGS